MKLLNIVFSAALIVATPFARAGLPNDELGRAIKIIRSEVKVPPAQLSSRIMRGSGIAVIGGLATSGFFALGAATGKGLGRGALPFALGHNVAVLGSIAFTAAAAWRLIGDRLRTKTGADFEGPAGLDRFVHLPLATQYRIASLDVDLAMFLIELAKTRDLVHRGFVRPAAPVVTNESGIPIPGAPAPAPTAPQSVDPDAGAYELPAE